MYRYDLYKTCEREKANENYNKKMDYLDYSSFHTEITQLLDKYIFQYK